MNKYIKRVLLSVLIVVVIVLIATVGLRGNLTVQNLNSSGNFLFDMVQKNYALSILVYILILALFTTVFSPGIIFLTITGGFLFGTMTGAIACNIGVALGSLFAFLSARYILHDLIRSRFKSRINAFDRHFRKEGRNYLLFLRLSPVIPAFLINLFAGLTKIRLWTFVWTTSLGSLPSDFIYSYIGNQIKNLRMMDKTFASEITIALVLLALVSLIPIWLRRREERE